MRSLLPTPTTRCRAPSRATRTRSRTTYAARWSPRLSAATARPIPTTTSGMPSLPRPAASPTPTRRTASTSTRSRAGSPLPADPRRRPGAGCPAGHADLRRRREHDGRRKLPLCVRCGEQAGFRISRFSGRRFARRRVRLWFQHEVPRPRNGACRLPAPFLQSRPRPLAQPRSNWSNNCAMGGG